ncbi:MAG: penicillin-binding protein 2, partial [Coxiellaceae bacterium]|nr:penicillin-binding protein 2 [Coxiellaceae bacterium]
MHYRARFWILITMMILASGCIIYRMVSLHILQRDFLLEQSNARIRRVVNIPAHRGMILDRNGKPLAISAQVTSAWVNPQLFPATQENLHALAALLDTSSWKLKHALQLYHNRSFMYLKRDIPPDCGAKLQALDLPGLFLEDGYKRYYPESDVMAHVVGFTNIDDTGQEGLELAYDKYLRGVPGKKEVVKDRRGHIIAELNSILAPEEGHDLTLSVDSGLQYLAYSELCRAIEEYQARSGSVVVLDVKTGEVLAMVNFPSFNPNHIDNTHDGRLRNRAVTDQFEPGSTIKAFSMTAILASHKYRPTDTINTSPGWMMLDGNVIKDVSNHGVLTVSEVMTKSSNIGFAIMATHILDDKIYNTFRDFGFGQSTYSGFPGESAG